jgi:hypothetical protein
MPRMRLPLAAAVLALTAGCLLIPTDSNRGVQRVSANVSITTDGRSPDSVTVQAQFYAVDGGRRINFTRDTLRVQNLAVGSPSGAVFHAQVALDGAARAQGIHVRLPQPRVSPLPLDEFTVFSAERGGPSAVNARAGQDLALPTVSGGRGTLPVPTVEHWTLSVARIGGRPTQISGSGPLPSPVIIPWVLVPAGSGDVLLVSAFSTRSHVLVTDTGAVDLMITASAQLEWTVRLVP